MGLIAKTYDLAKVILVVGGVPITGYGEDGGIEIEFTGPIHEVTEGADGLTVASKTNLTDAVATITLSEKAAGYLALATAMRLQEQDPSPVLLPVPFLLTDPSNGDVTSAAFTIFMARPTITKNRLAGERVFTMHLAGVAVTQIYGAANII
jgi:hypothetical protein